MSKHTPGPWHAPHFSDDDVQCNCTSIVSECYAGAICTFDINNGLRIGEGGNDAPPIEEAKANARLIAAAPKLLEALQKLLTNFQGEDELRLGTPNGMARELLACHAAIRKATAGVVTRLTEPGGRPWLTSCCP